MKPGPPHSIRSAAPSCVPSCSILPGHGRGPAEKRCQLERAAAVHHEDRGHCRAAEIPGGHPGRCLGWIEQNLGWQITTSTCFEGFFRSTFLSE